MGSGKSPILIFSIICFQIHKVDTDAYIDFEGRSICLDGSSRSDHWGAYTSLVFRQHSWGIGTQSATFEPCTSHLEAIVTWWRVFSPRCWGSDKFRAKERNIEVGELLWIKMKFTKLSFSTRFNGKIEHVWIVH